MNESNQNTYIHNSLLKRIHNEISINSSQIQLLIFFIKMEMKISMEKYK